MALAYAPAAGAAFAEYTLPAGVMTYAEAPAAAAYAANIGDTYMPPLMPANAQTPSYVPPQAYAQAPAYVPLPAYSQAPSCGAPPMPSYVPPPDTLAPPAPPQSLTQGLPTPEAVSRQKEEFAASLESQLQQRTQELEIQKAGQLRVARQNAEAEKRRAANQIDQQLVQTESQIQQHFSQQFVQLQQSVLEQKARLEQQAMELQMDYQQRRAQEEMQQSQYALQRQHFEDTQKLVAECQRLQPPAAAVTYALPACAPQAVCAAFGPAPATYAGIPQGALPTTVVVPTYATAAAYSTAYSMAPTYVATM